MSLGKIALIAGTSIFAIVVTAIAWWRSPR